MTIDQFQAQLSQKKNGDQIAARELRERIRDMRGTLNTMTELFRNIGQDVVVTMSESESLEWDSDLQRFVYHRHEISRYLELAPGETLFRVLPFFQDLLEKALPLQRTR